jgi:N-acetylmuramic acid 6-phosphate etherase
MIYHIFDKSTQIYTSKFELKFMATSKTQRDTEKESNYKHLERMSTKSLLNNMNKEDQLVPKAIKKAIPQIEKLVEQVSIQLNKGGRLFYIGAGTSGRLGIVDASECPPTYGVPHGLVIGLIAGGDQAIRKAVEFAEDDTKQGWKDLQAHKINAKDFLIGIAASGTTPYVLGALEKAATKGIQTGCIVCSKKSPIAKAVTFPIEVVVGPEFVTGSTRMKSGTAQKLCLNMISTSVMIKLGKVKGNKMVDMQLSNHKLEERAANMLMNEIKVSRSIAEKLLKQYGNMRKAADAYVKAKKKA